MLLNNIVAAALTLAVLALVLYYSALPQQARVVSFSAKSRRPPRGRHRARHLLVVQRVRHCVPDVPSPAAKSRKILYVRGCHAKIWRLVIDETASVGDLLRKIQRQYGVRCSDAMLYLSSRRTALRSSESIAELGLDSLSVITWLPRLRGGGSSASPSDDDSGGSGAEEDDSPSKPGPSQPATAQNNAAPSETSHLMSRKQGVAALSDAQAWNCDDKEIIDAASARWKSPVYDHYNIAVERGHTRDGDKKITFLFHCKYNEPKHGVGRQGRMETRSGTGNIGDSAKHCDDRRGVNSGKKQKQLTMNQAASKYTPHLHRAIISMRTAASNRPFNALADKYYRQEVELLRPGTKIPHRTTVSEDVKELHTEVRVAVQKYFKTYRGGVHVVLDGWTAPNVASYLGIVVVWWAKGKIHRSILEFEHLTAAHTGEHLADCLAKWLKAYHIVPFTLCADNATNNDTLVRSLPDHIPAFGGSRRRIRCFAHILNLIAKAYISFFFEKPKKVKKPVKVRAGRKRTATYVEQEEEHDVGEVIEDPDGIYLDDNSSEVDAAKEAHDTAVIGKATAAAYTAAIDYGIYVSEPEQTSALKLFPKVAGLARRVHDATVLADRLSKLIEGDQELRATTNKRALDRRVPTRWNSDLDCLDAHILLKKPVEQLTAEPAFDLSKYKLTPAQWTLSSKLQDVLQMFKGPTKIFSKTNVPLVHEVVPLIEKLEEKLVLVRDDEKQAPVMRVAAIGALEVVGKYYALSDDTEVYRIAMIMCPQRKLTWFHNHAWRPEDIAEARRITIACWNAYYKGEAPAVTAAAATPSAAPSGSSATAPKKKSAYALEDSDDEEQCAPGRQDTIESYLDSPTVVMSAINSFGGLMSYWEAQRKATPRVAQMALDFLSAPATSVDVERSFSNGRLKISHLQHNKSTKTFQAQMALGSWDGAPFWPGIDHCAEIIKTKSDGAKKAKTGGSTTGNSKDSAIVVG